jgi:hypothetical protein
MPGSFVVNVSDAATTEHPVAGLRIHFEDPSAPFPAHGVNIQVLPAGAAPSAFSPPAATPRPPW